MNPELLSAEAQDFINANLAGNATELLLKKSPFKQLTIQELSEQIQGKQRCRTKLPDWYRTPGIYYPPPLALEQCSSAATGAYKASLCSGDTLADLTGGAGVDSYYFSSRFSRVIHIEKNAHLSALAAHNLPLLGSDNVRFIAGDGMEFLSSLGAGSGLSVDPGSGSGNDFSAKPGSAPEAAIDCIYLDPSRRTTGNKKVFLPQDYEPDFIPRLEELVSAAGQVVIKTSPLVDIKYGLNTFRYVQSVHVVAVLNECKELIWVLGKQAAADPQVTCANIVREHTSAFTFNINEEEAAPPAALSRPLQYLYEPGAAILKAGAFKTLSKRLNIPKLHINSHLYTSPQPLKQFPGRSFQLRQQLTAREFGKLFKGRRLHIATRNFPETTAAIRKKYGISEGGDDYAFFTTLADNKRVVLLCRKQETAK